MKPIYRLGSDAYTFSQDIDVRSGNLLDCARTVGRKRPLLTGSSVSIPRPYGISQMGSVRFEPR
jgi:hypothetical protein